MVTQGDFLQTDSVQMWFPATLSKGFWKAVEKLPRLHEIAQVERGAEFKSKEILPQVPRFLEDEEEGFEPGFHFARGARHIHRTPRLLYLNLSEDVVQNYRGGIPKTKLDKGSGHSFLRSEKPQPLARLSFHRARPFHQEFSRDSAEMRLSIGIPLGLAEFAACQRIPLCLGQEKTCSRGYNATSADSACRAPSRQPCGAGGSRLPKLCFAAIHATS